VRADPAPYPAPQEAGPGVTIEIRILRDTLPEAELASGEIDLVLGFDEYMQVPGYLGKETWLTEPWPGWCVPPWSWRRSASPSTS
jgi:DNA-binding transcriptional LysR family regulator